MDPLFNGLRIGDFNDFFENIMIDRSTSKRSNLLSYTIQYTKIVPSPNNRT